MYSIMVITRTYVVTYVNPVLCMLYIFKSRVCLTVFKCLRCKTQHCDRIRITRIDILHYFVLLICGYVYYVLTW